MWGSFAQQDQDVPKRRKTSARKPSVNLSKIPEIELGSLKAQSILRRDRNATAGSLLALKPRQMAGVATQGKYGVLSVISSTMPVVLECVDRRYRDLGDDRSFRHPGGIFSTSSDENKELYRALIMEKYLVEGHREMVSAVPWDGDAPGTKFVMKIAPLDESFIRELTCLAIAREEILKTRHAWSLPVLHDWFLVPAAKSRELLARFSKVDSSLDLGVVVIEKGHSYASLLKKRTKDGRISPLADPYYDLAVATRNLPQSRDFTQRQFRRVEWAAFHMLLGIVALERAGILLLDLKPDNVVFVKISSRRKEVDSILPLNKLFVSLNPKGFSSETIGTTLSRLFGITPSSLDPSEGVPWLRTNKRKWPNGYLPTKYFYYNTHRRNAAPEDEWVPVFIDLGDTSVVPTRGTTHLFSYPENSSVSRDGAQTTRVYASIESIASEGTLAYSPSESVFSLGHTLFVLVANRHPFFTDSRVGDTRHTFEDNPPAYSSPDFFSRLIEQLYLVLRLQGKPPTSLQSLLTNSPPWRLLLFFQTIAYGAILPSDRKYDFSREMFALVGQLFISEMAEIVGVQTMKTFKTAASGLTGNQARYLSEKLNVYSSRLYFTAGEAQAHDILMMMRPKASLRMTATAFLYQSRIFKADLLDIGPTKIGEEMVCL